jgi:hypothetical protein
VFSFLVAAVAGCHGQGSLSDSDRQAATAEVSIALDSMNAAWRRADFVAATRPLLDGGLTTLNHYRVRSDSLKASVQQDPSDAWQVSTSRTTALGMMSSPAIS